MAKRHVMTAARRAALRKAQLASARKRGKGGSRKRTARRVATGVGVLAALGGAAAYRKSDTHFRHKSAMQASRLVASYVNAGTKHNGEKMTRRQVVSYARSENKLYKSHKIGNVKSSYPLSRRVRKSGAVYRGNRKVGHTPRSAAKYTAKWVQKGPGGM